MTSPSAEDLFADHLARIAAGENVDFAALCRAHPEHAAALVELQALHAVADRLMPPPLDEAPPVPLRPGALRVDARYQTRGEIGRGGMGIVLRVWDTELDRTLAMKVERHPGAGVDRQRRFLAEARITSQLDHPGIVPVHEIGTRIDGTAFYTMRLVEGDDLDEVFERVRAGADGWTLARAVDVLSKVCEAMSYAHSKGVIHRDLKPGNVRVGPFGGVYVMDWGLARVVGRPDHLGAVAPEQGADVARLTRYGTALGTPYYMAPEQARGELDRIGPAADVYAVGAMLYELLAGAAPYVEPGRKQSSEAILERVRAAAPRSLDARGRRVQVELAAICSRAMAREPGDRYASMQALADDLHAFTERRVVRAYETGTWAETRKWMRRNPALATVSAGVVLATVLASLFAVQSVAHAAERDRATALAEQGAYLATEFDRAQLVRSADELWPATPDLLPRLEAALRQARELLDGRTSDADAWAARPGLAQLRRELAALRSTALPRSQELLARDREHHPRFAERERMRLDLQWRSRMLGSEPWPSLAAAEVEVDTWSLPEDPLELLTFLAPRASPDRARVDNEMELLVLARRVLAGVPDDHRTEALTCLACALCSVGDVAGARATLTTAQKQTPEALRGKLDGAEKFVASWEGDEARAQQRRQRDDLAAAVAQVGAEVDARYVWEFAASEVAWRHEHLTKLVADLEALAAPTGLLSDAVAPPFGWGIARRIEFARTVRARSIDDALARAAWDSAIAAVRASDRYGHLQLAPQLGLLPLGADPDSGLWEFAHLQSGEPAVRGADGRLRIEDATGIVLVLIPGGSFAMGAQRDNPKGDNYDPLAENAEGPRHLVDLSPFFLSKYEMSMGQWRRIAGANPSQFDPVHVLKDPAPYPVESVTWDDCSLQVRRLGLRLPSEAQWEYACRAGTTTPWWTGAERESLRDATTGRGLVNIADRTARRFNFKWPSLEEWPDYHDDVVSSARLGRFPANPWGLHEILGNLSEWCEDDDASYELLRRRDPVAQNAFGVKVYRGGNFTHGPSRVRCAARLGGSLTYKNGALGLRPAREVAR